MARSVSRANERPGFTSVVALSLGMSLGVSLGASPGASPGVAWANPNDGPQRPAGFMGAQLAVAPSGLRIENVVEDGPGFEAGLRTGDVIVEAHGMAPGSVTAFTLSVRAAGAGADYALVVERNHRRVPLTVHLGEPPAGGASGSMPHPGQTPPALSARVVLGAGPADLGQLRGRVVLLDFWASWCGPCRMMMPVLNGLSQRYAAQGLTVLGVTDDAPSVARQVGESMHIQYTLATDPGAMGRYRVESLPTLLVIDRAGHVRDVTVGAGGVRELEALVRRLLAEPPP